jgi:hypothetical protein
MPLFYSRPVPLNSRAHAKMRLRMPRTFKFARRTNAVPLMIEEFAVAQRHYPIVFSPGDPAFPAALVGLGAGENLMVGADGQWRAGAYIPAYVRRFPFISMGDGAGGQSVLAVEEGGEIGEFAQGMVLFENEKPTPALEEMSRFCMRVEAQAALTRAFAGALGEHGLFAEKQADINLPNGQVYSLKGFRIVDEA